MSLTLLLSLLIPLLIGLLIFWFATARAMRHLRRRLRRATRRTLRDFRVKINRSKLSPKGHICEMVMKDPEVVAGIVEHSKETGCKLAEAEQRAEIYVDEIVPAFSAFYYYVFGYWISRLLLNLIYQIDVEREPEELDDAFHGKNAVIYVANHRSNVDYVLLSYVLTRRVALSYAVGEWARVWPLESLFKSFGSYFIRRGFREKLYHTVLRRYVQLITRQGITQGVFIEGGLSRDGKLRPVKIGMLDYLTQVLRESGFEKEDIVFVPVGLNYDRVLEDRPLTNEHLKRRLTEDGRELPKLKDQDKKQRRGLARRWRRRARMLKRVLGLLFSNLSKYWSRSLRKHGRAAVRFGQPVSFKAWHDAQEQNVVQLGRAERLPEIARFAEDLLGEIGRTVPATPVTVFCQALVECGLDQDIDEQTMRETILRNLIALEDLGARRSPANMDREQIIKEARQRLVMRRLIEDHDEFFRVPEHARIIIEYYAGSLQQFFESPSKPQAPSGDAPSGDAPSGDSPKAEAHSQPEAKAVDEASS